MIDTTKVEACGRQSPLPVANGRESCGSAARLKSDKLMPGPDTCSKQPIGDPQAKAVDEAKAILEKKTMVTMAHAFACATKHYLRGEEGM